MKLEKWILGLFVCTALSGCSSLTKSDKPKSKKETSWLPWSKKEYPTPQSMAAIWTEDVLTAPDQPATRGFGGRIYFYNEKGQAIPVEGELIVHGYDETENQSDSKASKKFRFTSEQFTQHFSQSELGASYSVWIPWDALGGFQKKIMLIPTFITKDQRMVRGNAAKVTLAGKSPSGLESYQSNTVSQVSHVVPTNEVPLPRLSESNAESMRTTTIQIPNSSSKRWTAPNASLNQSAGSGQSRGELPSAVTYANGMNPQVQNAQALQSLNPAAIGNLLNQIQAASAQTGVAQNAAFAPSALANGASPYNPGMLNPQTMNNQFMGNGFSQNPNGFPQSGAMPVPPMGNYPPNPGVPNGAQNNMQGNNMQGNNAQGNNVQNAGMNAMSLNNQVQAASANGFARQNMAGPAPMSSTLSGFPTLEFPQLDWSAQTARFGPNQSRAPSQPAGPSTSYPPR